MQTNQIKDYNKEDKAMCSIKAYPKNTKSATLTFNPHKLIMKNSYAN